MDEATRRKESPLHVKEMGCEKRVGKAEGCGIWGLYKGGPPHWRAKRCLGGGGKGVSKESRTRSQRPQCVTLKTLSFHGQVGGDLRKPSPGQDGCLRGRRASRRSIPPASPWSSTSPPDCTSLPGSPQLCVPQLAAEQKQHQRERRVPIPHQKNTPNLSLLVPAIQVSTGVELSQHTQLD